VPKVPKYSACLKESKYGLDLRDWGVNQNLENAFFSVELGQKPTNKMSSNLKIKPTVGFESVSGCWIIDSRTQKMTWKDSFDCCTYYIRYENAKSICNIKYENGKTTMEKCLE